MKAALTFFVLVWIISARAEENSAVKAEPRNDEAWKQKHETMVARAATHPDIVFLGDSITELWDVADLGGNVWKEYYGSRPAVTQGIGGDFTQHVLWRLQNGELPEGSHPKVVVLLVGTNNIYSNSPAQIAAGVQAIIDEILHRSPNTKILLMGVFPRGEKADNGDRPKVKAMNEEIAKLDNQKTVFYQDIGALFLQPDGSISKETMIDFIHPSAKGYRIWADAIQAPVEKLAR